MFDSLLTLEKLEGRRFEANHHQNNFRNTLFGGQVLAQALMAAGETTDRPANSLHAYFLRPGVSSLPVYYDIAILRDGQSVATRRVDAIQNGEVIFTMNCSFHRNEKGFEHQHPPMPNVRSPEELIAAFSLKEKEKLEKITLITMGETAVQFVPCDANIFTSDQAHEPHAQFWFKTPHYQAPSPLHGKASLAFCSDIGLLPTALLPHSTSMFSGDVLPASMDHSIWFHGEFCPSDWHLYSTVSPWAGHARGYCRGSVYNRQGTLVASIAQEGLIRPLK